MVPYNGPLKQAVVVRADLEMGKGKIAAQASHASLTAADKSPFKKHWVAQGQKKVVLKVSSEQELLEINMQARKAGVTTALIEDAGHTQVEGGTKTAVGIGPGPEHEIDKITGHLKLL